MDHFGAKFLLFIAVALLVGSHFVIDVSPHTGTTMRWIGFIAIGCSLIFRD